MNESNPKIYNSCRVEAEREMSKMLSISIELTKQTLIHFRTNKMRPLFSAVIITAFYLTISFIIIMIFFAMDMRRYNFFCSARWHCFFLCFLLRRGVAIECACDLYSL